MGCDASRSFCPGRCLYRGLRVLSELGWAGLKDGQGAPPFWPRVLDSRLRGNDGGRIGQMGCDGPRRFVPMVVCIGDCACCLNRRLG